MKVNPWILRFQIWIWPSHSPSPGFPDMFVCTSTYSNPQESGPLSNANMGIANQHQPTPHCPWPKFNLRRTPRLWRSRSSCPQLAGWVLTNELNPVELDVVSTHNFKFFLAQNKVRCWVYHLVLSHTKVSSTVHERMSKARGSMIVWNMHVRRQWLCKEKATWSISSPAIISNRNRKKNINSASGTVQKK